MASKKYQRHDTHISAEEKDEFVLFTMVSFFETITFLLVALGVSVSDAAFVNPSSQNVAFRQSSRIVPTGTTTTSIVVTPTTLSTPVMTTYRETKTAHSMSMSMSMLDMNSLVLATIDADIANIDDNKFGLVFAGGIAVMVGGVLSALIVGFILERGDLYASVVADSYLQGAQDEEFWKGLSEEEKKKTQELLSKVKASKAGETIDTTAQHGDSASDGYKTPQVTVSEEKKEVGMFSDYDQTN